MVKKLIVLMVLALLAITASASEHAAQEGEESPVEEIFLNVSFDEDLVQLEEEESMEEESLEDVISSKAISK